MRGSMLGPVVSSQPAAKRHPPVNTSQIKEMRGPQDPGKVPAAASCCQALGQFPCVALAPFQGAAKSLHPANLLAAEPCPALAEATCLHRQQDGPRAQVQPWAAGDVSPAPALLRAPPFLLCGTGPLTSEEDPTASSAQASTVQSPTLHP